MLKVYSFNLLLIPVNLGGVLKSIEQGITRRKIPFGREPKVKGHTAAPLNYLLAEYALLVLIAVSVVISALEGDYLHLAYALINAAFFAYALKLLGVKRSIGDIAVQVRRSSGAGQGRGRADQDTAESAKTIVKTRSAAARIVRFRVSSGWWGAM